MTHLFFNTLIRLRSPAFWALSLLISFGMAGHAIAQGTATPAPTPAGGVSTTAQRQQLNRLQGSAASEINRRLSLLNDIKDDLSHSRTIDGNVIKGMQEEVEQQVVWHTDIKNAIESYTSLPSVQADVAKVNEEYPRYVMTVRKGYLLVSADFQSHLQKKNEQLAAKFQKRLTFANNNGKDVAAAQTVLNDMRSNLHRSEELVREVIVEVPPVALGSYETNKAWMAYKQSRLAESYKKLQNCVKDADILAKTIDANNL